jgi:hypothetical protein
MDAKYSMALVTGLLCFLAVCSSRSAYSAPSSGPCSLLTPAQISAVLSLNVAAGKPLGTKSCDWTAPGQPIGINAKKVTVTLLDEQGFAYAKMPVNFKGITKTSVSGIGDDAVYGTAAGQGTLSVKKGNSAFAVHVYGFPLDQIEAKEKTLALEILSKL